MTQENLKGILIHFGNQIQSNYEKTLQYGMWRDTLSGKCHTITELAELYLHWNPEVHNGKYFNKDNQDLHTCRFCGVETTQPDSECFKGDDYKPINT